MKRFVVSGGAGFLGSHICERLVADGGDVLCLDNLMTGHEDNLRDLRGEASFAFERRDVREAFAVAGPVDAVLHLASPASPPDYLAHPVTTLEIGSLGTQRMLDLAREKAARFFIASTSEVYGDPHVSPQREDYWGNVNPVGPRSVYDEAKRYAEAITTAYHRHYGLDVRIARIFNVYGPRLRVDGRVVSNFIDQALGAKPLTVYGDGTQTRSFCYVDDEVEGLLGLLRSDLTTPCNVGNPGEFTVLELADLVRELTGSASEVVHEPLPEDDPRQRRPDISLARSAFGWEPKVPLRDGLARTIEWYRTEDPSR